MMAYNNRKTSLGKIDVSSGNRAHNPLVASQGPHSHILMMGGGGVTIFGLKFSPNVIFLGL